MPGLINAGDRVRDEKLPLVLIPNKDRTRASIFFVKRQRGMPSATWYKIGVWPDVTVQSVKDVAKRLLADSSLGIDITGSATKHQHNDFDNYSDVLDWYLTDPLAINDHSDSRRKNIRTLINLHIHPALGAYKISKLNEPVIKKVLIDRMAKDGYALSYIDLVVRTIRQSLTAALRLKVITDNPLSSMTIKSFTTAKIKPKKAAYHAGQLSVVIQAIDKEPRHWVRFMTAMILLHGLRVEEVAGLNWSTNIDANNKMLRLAADQTKNGQPHLLPLTEIASQLLRYHKRMQRSFGHRGNWLLPARRNPRRSINASYASDLVSNCLGNGSAHDLRKMAREWWQENKVDFYVGELLLNHKSGVLAQTYLQTLLLEPCRDALNLWHSELSKMGIIEAVCKN